MPVPLDILPPALDVPTCCGADAPPTPAAESPVTTRFHFSLNVADLERSVAFYRKLFGADPAKHYPDYAKFELTQPPLVFSLVPNAPASTGALSHLGFPVASLAEVEAVSSRLTAAGLAVSCQNGTVCGYAQQDKIWVSDPDHNFWEIYVVYSDVDPATVRRAFDGVSPLAANPTEPAAAPARIVWEHMVAQPVPERISHSDASVDEVRLTGTFNAALSAAERARLLAEALRVLKPEGRLSVHGLVASAPLTTANPHLPGVAALVKRVPLENEPGDELRAAGFHNIQITRLPQSPAFQQGPVEMRELKLQAGKPAVAATGSEQRLVVYKGPLAEAQDDSGTVFVRGRRTRVTGAQWDDLARSSAASQFLFIDEASAGCGT